MCAHMVCYVCVWAVRANSTSCHWTQQMDSHLKSFPPSVHSSSLYQSIAHLSIHPSLCPLSIILYHISLSPSIPLSVHLGILSISLLPSLHHLYVYPSRHLFTLMNLLICSFLIFYRILSISASLHRFIHSFISSIPPSVLPVLSISRHSIPPGFRLTHGRSRCESKVFNRL